MNAINPDKFSCTLVDQTHAGSMKTVSKLPVNKHLNSLLNWIYVGVSHTDFKKMNKSWQQQSFSSEQYNLAKSLNMEKARKRFSIESNTDETLGKSLMFW